jgi:catechol 2,3-dioxygenase-like lactoylglutathione lyase family enzyme
MARVLEMVTVNIAVPSIAEAVPRYEALGLAHVDPVDFPEPPIQMTDVSFPIPGASGFSLIQANSPDSPVARFIDRRGPGCFSIAVRVDDLAEAMRDWSFQWVLSAPDVMENGRAARYVVERLLMNWVKPQSFGGVLLEVFEFQGRVRLYGQPEAPGGVESIGDVFYRVRDLDAAVAFYRDRLGLKLKFRDRSAWAAFDVGGATLALEGGPTSSIQVGATVCLKVADVGVWAREAAARGVTVGAVEAGTHELRTEVHDPDGNRLLVYSPLSDR